MRPFLTPILAFFAFVPGLFAQYFGTNFAPVLTLSESYSAFVESDGSGGFQLGNSSSLSISARCSMQGIDLTSINEGTEVTLNVGDLSLDHFLGDDPNYTAGDTSATIPLVTLSDGLGTQVGTLHINWTSAVIYFTLLVRNDSADYEMEAADIANEDDPSENGQAVDYQTLTLTFAATSLDANADNPQTLGPVTLYDTETINLSTDNRVSGYPGSVRVSGLIDSLPPTNVAITSPASGSTIFTATATVQGTAIDALSGLSSVLVQINDGAFLSAQIQAAPDWTLTDVPFIPGRNKLVVKASDNAGNTKITTPIYVTYSDKSLLTVQAAGAAPGKVTSTLFKTIDYVPGNPSPTGTSTLQAGSKARLTAVPGTGSFFAGWTSTAGAVPNADSASLTYAMTPNVTLTANFIVNPYLPLQGKYDGLIAGGDVTGNGFFTATVTPNGLFTGTIKIGALSLPIQGGLGPNEQFSGSFKKGGATYAVMLKIAPSGNGGAGQITGTITGPNSLNSSIGADVAAFKKNTNQLPQEDVGSFNVLLPPAQANTDANFPVGIGYGRVTISALGAVRFAGKAGDGSMLTAGTTLSQDDTWPFYASLYSGGGSISGPLSVDTTKTDTDLSGVLAWNRPAVASAKPKPFALGFTGGVDFTAARWTPWKKSSGELSFLNPSNGAGTLSLDAPAVASASLAALANDSALTLSGADIIAVTPSDSGVAAKIKVTITPSTGLFTGSFVDASNHSHSYGGVIVSTPGATPKTDAAGGFFVWGTATGSVQINPTP